MRLKARVSVEAPEPLVIVVYVQDVRERIRSSSLGEIRLRHLDHRQEQAELADRVRESSHN